MHQNVAIWVLLRLKYISNRFGNESLNDDSYITSYRIQRNNINLSPCWYFFITYHISPAAIITWSLILKFFYKPSFESGSDIKAGIYKWWILIIVFCHQRSDIMLETSCYWVHVSQVKKKVKRFSVKCFSTYWNVTWHRT